MKKLLFWIVISLLSNVIFAQIKPKQEDWFAYDFSYVSILNSPATVSQMAFSNSHSISFTHDIVFGKSPFSIAAGLGFTSQNIHQNMKPVVDEQTGKEHFKVMHENSAALDSVVCNKLKSQYIHIPIELRFRGKSNDKGQYFRFYVGSKWGVQLRNFARYETETLNVQYNALELLNKFNGSAYTRIGYSYFSVYASYTFTPIFAKGQVDISNNALPQYVSLKDMRFFSLGLSVNL